MNVKRSDRLYKSDRMNYILSRMRSQQDVTPALLAEELHVSERTVYRDLRYLQKGDSLHKRYSRREGRYLLETELRLPPLLLTASEALAIYSAASNPALSQENFFAADLRAGLRKIAAILSPADTLSDPAPSPTESEVRVPPTYASMSEGLQRPLLEIIRRAVRLHRKLNLHYWQASGSRDLTLAPYDLREMDGEWYLLGTAEETPLPQIYQVTRIRRFEILPERFRMPRRFAPDAAFDAAWSEFDRADSTIQVVLRFAPTLAEHIRDCKGPQFVAVETEPDGSLTATAQVYSLNEIRWWVLAYGSEVEVLEPRQLRDEIAQAGRNLAARYADLSAPPTLLE